MIVGDAKTTVTIFRHPSGQTVFILYAEEKRE